MIKRRSIAFVLSLAMMMWTVPAGVYGLESQVAQGSVAVGNEGAADNGQVVVLYEDGEVDTAAPKTNAEKSKVKKARTSRAFGMSTAGGDSKDLTEAENTLGQQSDILGDALGSSYMIEDTVVFEGEKKTDDDTVVSVISSDKYSADEMAERLSASDKVRIAEPDYVFHMAGFPAWSDTYLQDAWQNGEKGINADKAWENKNFDKTDDPVIIAVMDTGIDYRHEELKDRMWVKPDKGDLGKLNGKYGVDFSASDSDPMDENGHGTHCAGIIAAAADNNAGVAGVAGKSSRIKLMAVRILDAEGAGELSSIVRGFRYLILAKKAGANIKAVNCSFGASVTSEIFDEIVELAGAEGILTIAAAGNETANNDQVPSSPANCKSRYVVSVAALDNDGSLASYSNYGRRNVDIAAPGSNILSTVSYNNYTPYLYSQDLIKKTTQYYSGFTGATLSTGADGSTEVTPTAGLDHSGKPVSGVKGLGTSVSLTSLMPGSSGKAELSLTDPASDEAFPIGSNKTSLRWTITGAKAGDTYVLYFPYEKQATNAASTYLNMVLRSHTEIDELAVGALDFGDVIAYTDDEGNVAYRTVSTEDMFGMSMAVSKDMNSIWQASGTNEVMYPRASLGDVAEKKTEEVPAGKPTSGYGVGLVYNAMEDGDIYVDISSIAISKASADPETFGKYDVYSGTSMATPVVTGAAAVIAAMNPGITADQLRDTLYQTTRSGYSDVCSTGGAVDFARYSKAAESSVPAIGDAYVDYKNKTITLQTSGAGSSPEISAYFNFADITADIDANDIVEKGDDYITFKDRHNMIGSEVTFTVKNTESGESGQRTFFVVKGLKSYKDLYTMDQEQEDFFFFDWSKRATIKDMEEEEIAAPFPAGGSYLPGADKMLVYNDDAIYELMESGKTYTPLARGFYLSVAVDDYMKKAAKKCDLWDIGDVTDTTSDMGDAYPYTIERLGDPVCMGNVVYELVKVDMVDRTGFLLMGLDINGENDQWTVYYDSLAGLGSAPSSMNLKELNKTVLAGYKGKLYLIGNGYKPVSDEQTDADDEDKDKIRGSWKTFCCVPKASGSVWKKSADIPVNNYGGKAIGQGGNLYYFFGVDSDNKIDYVVYKFDGSSWQAVGILPEALASTEGEEIPEILQLFGIKGSEGGVKCALGIDNKGIIVAGGSFDGGGDTFRFNTKTCRVQRLGYTLWGDAADRETNGTVADGRLIVQYNIKDNTKATAKYIKVKDGYVHLAKSYFGLGKGTIVGGGSYPKGETSPVRITPAKGSYIYEIHTTGLAKNFNKKYGKSTKASRKSLSTTFKAKKDATITVEFGKVSTKMKVPKNQTVTVGKHRIKGKTNGTISDVKWKSCNKKYAVVNKNGTITFKKAGIGKKVKLIATSKERPKLKATTTVKIKAKKKAAKTKTSKKS